MLADKHTEPKMKSASPTVQVIGEAPLMPLCGSHCRKSFLGKRVPPASSGRMCADASAAEHSRLATFFLMSMNVMMVITQALSIFVFHE